VLTAKRVGVIPEARPMVDRLRQFGLYTRPFSMRRPERSYLVGVNSSLFEFRPIPEAFQTLGAWYEEGKIHRTLTEIMVRSKSEVIIANMLAERDIPFLYEVPLFAPDGTFYLPDFTVTARGEQWYWEHLGRLDQEEYRNHWETKKAWYDRFFPGRLVVTEESGKLSQEADRGPRTGARSRNETRTITRGFGTALFLRACGSMTFT